MKLKELRKSRKLTQDEVAKTLNVSRATYNGYELGKYEPNIITLCRLAELFNVSLDELLGRDTRLINLASLEDNTREAINAVLEMTPDEVDKLLNIIKIVKS